MTSPPAKKSSDQTRSQIRFKHNCLSNENTYISWIEQYIIFNGKRHPTEIGAAEVAVFLTDLATRRLVSSSTQKSSVVGDFVFVSRRVGVGIALAG